MAFLVFLPFSLLCQTRGTSVSNYDFSGAPAAAVSLPPWNVSAGGTIVGCARFSNSLTTAISVMDTGSANTFTVTNYANEGNNTRVAMFKAENTTPVTGDVLTIRFSSGGAGYTAEAAVQYSGTAASSYDTGATGNPTGTTATSGAFTTTQGPEIAVACGSYADTSVQAGLVGTIPMSIAVTDSPNRIIAIEDANLYQIQTNVTATMSSGSAQPWGFIVGTFKSSNPVSPPTLSETISGTSATVAGVPYIYVGASATVSFTVTNTNPSVSLSGIVFSNTLPTGMIIATPNGLGGSCPGGTIDAAAGSGTISLSGAVLPAAATCTFSVNITSTAAGIGVNTTGNITATETRNGGMATATLVVYGPPAITISGISVNALDHASVNLTYSTSAPGYCQLQFGLASGTYIYSGGSAASYLNGCQISIGGLAPGTTYYVMPTARPDANDTNGLCQVGGSCGSSEQTFTTPELPVPHPAPPVAPSVWTPVEPNTSSYTVVSMQANPSDGTCVAAGSVSKQTHWSAPVAAGDSLQKVVNEIWFDTVIEFPEGSSCAIPADSGGFHTGVTLPQYTPNGGASDWVVIRTHANAASDLPPFGVRTGPQFASKLATLVAQTPGMPVAPGSSTQNFNGQIFDCDANGCNHFWIENVAMTHAFNSTLYPPGTVDPPAFVDYVRFIPQCVFAPNNGCSISSAATTPSYMVLDRVYAYGQPWPSRETGCFVPGGNHWALINNYCTTNFWVEAVYPKVNPTSSGAVVTIPNSYFQFNAFDNTPLGMTTPAGYAATSATPLTIGTGVQTLTTQSGLSYTAGNLVEILNTGSTSNYMIGAVTSYSGTTLVAYITAVSGTGGSFSAWNLVSPAVATFTVPNGYAGVVYAWLDSSGLTIDYQTGSGVSLSCTGCNAKSETTPSRLGVPPSSMYYFNGHFANGSFVLDASTPSNVNPSIFTAFRPLGIYFYPGQYGVFDNNYIQAIGQTVYNDTYGPVEDISWTHNYFYFPRSKMQNSGQWDGYGYSFRNVIESKQQLRGQYIGNIIDGSASFQNPGNAIYIAGSYAGPYSTGTQDINIASNVFRHLSTGFQIAGGGAASPPDSPTAARIGITNNLFLDLNRDLYNNGGGGLASGSFSAYPLVSDINFSHNTVGLTRGIGPALIEIGGAATTATSVMGEGFLYSNNVVLASLGGLDAIISIDGGQNAAYSNFPTNPTVSASATTPAPPGTWAAYLSADFIHTGASITPSWSIGNNLIIGAQNNRGQPAGTWVDLTPAQINASIQALWPASDTTSRFPCSSTDTLCPGGTTLASRLSAVGWSPTMNLAGGNPDSYAIMPTKYNGGEIGANVTTVDQATGVVRKISINPGPTSLQFSYVAPDARSCSVDISPDGTTWTRMTDAGGGFSRSLTFTGLTGSVPYRYRIMCYFDQSAAYEFLPTQITSGTTSTAAGVARTVFQEFTLPPGASRAVFSFVPAEGPAVNQICSRSPCSVSLNAGDWTRTLTFETSSSIAVGDSSVTNMTIE